MSYFDSPIGRCELMHTMVLIDQTQAECATEHACPRGCLCSLAGCFADIHTLQRNSQEHAGAGLSSLR